MLEGLNILGWSYEYILVVVNAVSAVSFLLLSVYIAISWTVGILKSPYKKGAIAVSLSLISLCIVYFLCSICFGIMAIVLPLQNVYFIAFMQLIQYIVAFVLASLCVAILFFLDQSQINGAYSYRLMSACLASMLLTLMHHWIASALGAPLIFSPSLW